MISDLEEFNYYWNILTQQGRVRMSKGSFLHSKCRAYIRKSENTYTNEYYQYEYQEANGKTFDLALKNLVNKIVNTGWKNSIAKGYIS